MLSSLSDLLTLAVILLCKQFLKSDVFISEFVSLLMCVHSRQHVQTTEIIKPHYEKFSKSSINPFIV